MNTLKQLFQSNSTDKSDSDSDTIKQSSPYEIKHIQRPSNEFKHAHKPSYEFRHAYKQSYDGNEKRSPLYDNNILKPSCDGNEKKSPLYDNNERRSPLYDNNEKRSPLYDNNEIRISYNNDRRSPYDNNEKKHMYKPSYDTIDFKNEPNILQINHVMFPIYNNNNFLLEVEEEYKDNKKYIYDISEQSPLCKGIYLYGKSFYIEHLSTIKGEIYWNNALGIILNKNYWSHYVKPEFINEYFLIPKYSCGYFFISPDYPFINSNKIKSDYDNFIIYISRNLARTLIFVGGGDWTLPRFIKINEELKHPYDIVVKDNKNIVGPLFQSNLPGSIF